MLIIVYNISIQWLNNFYIHYYKKVFANKFFAMQQAPFPFQHLCFEDTNAHVQLNCGLWLD